VLLLVLGAGLSAFTILRGLAPHDEGLMLQAGARIASGQWPYHDFWLNYPPGQPVVLAGLQEIFGASLLAWRVLMVAINAVVALLAYRLARRRAPESYALVAWLAVAAAMAYPFLPGPNPPALALAFGGLLVSRERPLRGGLLAGLACCFRFEIGVAAVLGAVLEAPRGGRLRALGGGVIGAVVPLVPFYLAAPHAMFHDTIGFYAIQDLQRLAFPLSFHGPVRPSKLIEFYIPLILVVSLGVWAAAMGAAVITRRYRPHARAALHGGITAQLRARQPGPGLWSLAPLAVVGLGYLLGRADEFHLVPLAAVLPVMLAWAAADAQLLWLRLLLLLGLLLITVHGVERRAGQALHPPALASVPGPAGDGVKTDPPDARSLASLQAEIDGLTRPAEPIFVAVPRFDRVHAGDPLLYVLLDRPNPTRYDVMQPGLVTTASVQREMVASLERSRTRVVIRWLDPRATLIEPNGGGRSSGVHIMDRYLASSFRPLTRFGVYQVLIRRHAPR
jgi:hypothetical protein